MATLLAAVLIAMMGIMPALAPPTASVPLTVTVFVPIISISVDPTSVDFGTPRPGDAPTAKIVITNNGNVDVTVSETVSGTFFIANLAVSGTYVSIAISGTGDADLTLTIPGGTSAGLQTGSILFTASETT